MTDMHHDNAPPTSAAPPLELSYHDAPVGDVVASEIALTTLRKTRLWAMLFAIGLFVYALPGLVLGTIWMVIAITKRGQAGYGHWEFIIASTINLVMGSLAMVGGILAVRYANGAGRAYARRNPEDLERAMKRQLLVWRWAVVTLVAMGAIPVLIFGFAALLGVWP